MPQIVRTQKSIAAQNQTLRLKLMKRSLKVVQLTENTPCQCPCCSDLNTPHHPHDVSHSKVNDSYKNKSIGIIPGSLYVPRSTEYFVPLVAVLNNKV